MNRFSYPKGNPFYLWTIIPFILFFNFFINSNHSIEHETGKSSATLLTSYETVSDGLWSASSTWMSGMVPSLPLSGDQVTILHKVTYDGSDDIEINDGSTLSITGGIVGNGHLVIPVSSDKNISVGKTYSGSGTSGTFNMSEGELDMQGTSGNLQFFENSKATIEYSKMNVANDWKSEDSSVDRSIEGGCLFIENGNFSNKGTDTYAGVCLDIKNGNWKNEGTIFVGIGGITVRVQNDNFTNDGTVNSMGGHFDYVFSSGNIEQNSSWADAVDLVAYCGTLSSGWPGDTPNSQSCGTESTYYPCEDNGCKGLSPTPVELTFFEGYKQTHSNLLEWKTDSETDNSYFEILRSIDARHFETIGIVNGAGTVEEGRQYIFKDAHPLPFAYYKLKQVDFDGSHEYFSTISIKREDFKVHLEILPNITTDEVNIRISTLGDNEKQKRSILKIVNSQGQLIYEEQFYTRSSIEYRSVSMKNHQPGMYFVLFQNNNDYNSGRFVLNGE